MWPTRRRHARNCNAYLRLNNFLSAAWIFTKFKVNTLFTLLFQTVKKKMRSYRYFCLSKIICKPGAKFENPIGKFVIWHHVFNIISFILNVIQLRRIFLHICLKCMWKENEKKRRFLDIFLPTSDYFWWWDRNGTPKNSQKRPFFFFFFGWFFFM